jgi:hypothetical protein
MDLLAHLFDQVQKVGKRPLVALKQLHQRALIASFCQLGVEIDTAAVEAELPMHGFEAAERSDEHLMGTSGE